MKVTITHTIKRNGKTVANKGDVMTLAKAQGKKIKRDYYTTVVATAVGNYYTRDEDVRIVTLYLANNDNIAAATAAFCDENNRHSADSVRALIAGLRTLDSHYPNDTEWVIKSHLREVASEMVPHRFS